MIPQEAIEAAAKGIAAENLPSKPWETMGEGVKETFRADAQAALTAAAPFIRADAKREALEEAADWLHGEGDEDREEGTVGLWLRGRAKGHRAVRGEG